MYASHSTAAILQLQRLASSPAPLLYIPAPAGLETSQIRYTALQAGAVRPPRLLSRPAGAETQPTGFFKDVLFPPKGDRMEYIRHEIYMRSRPFPVRDDGRLKTLLTTLAQEHYGTPMQYPRHYLDFLSDI